MRRPSPLVVRNTSRFESLVGPAVGAPIRLGPRAISSVVPKPSNFASSSESLPGNAKPPSKAATDQEKRGSDTSKRVAEDISRQAPVYRLYTKRIESLRSMASRRRVGK